MFPNIKYCGDNAAMIALTGIKRFRNNLGSDVQITAKSRWPLDPGAPFMKGPGLKLWWLENELLAIKIWA